jgi:hypothetical protein
MITLVSTQAVATTGSRSWPFRTAVSEASIPRPRSKPISKAAWLRSQVAVAEAIPRPASAVPELGRLLGIYSANSLKNFSANWISFSRFSRFFRSVSVGTASKFGTSSPAPR